MLEFISWSLVAVGEKGGGVSGATLGTTVALTQEFSLICGLTY